MSSPYDIIQSVNDGEKVRVKLKYLDVLLTAAEARNIKCLWRITVDGDSCEIESTDTDIPAGLKPDWKMPDPPDKTCGFCGKPLNVPYAYPDTHEWYMGWMCEDECGWDETFMKEWPFMVDRATPDDLRRAGFRIVEG